MTSSSDAETCSSAACLLESIVLNCAGVFMTLESLIIDTFYARKLNFPDVLKRQVTSWNAVCGLPSCSLLFSRLKNRPFRTSRMHGVPSVQLCSQAHW